MESKTVAADGAEVKSAVAADVKSVAAPVKNTKLFPIGNGKYVKVSHYRKAPYVNIRDYTTSFNGQLYATKRGILLRPEEWKQLKKCFKDVEQELKLNF